MEHNGFALPHDYDSYFTDLSIDESRESESLIQIVYQSSANTKTKDVVNAISLNPYLYCVRVKLRRNSG